MSVSKFQPIIAAVAADGFTPKVTSTGLELIGEIEVDRRRVPLRVRFDDPTLADGPRLYLPDISMLGRKVVPHVDEDLELCAVDRKMFVFDRFSAPEQTRGLIRRATEVLSRGMTKAGTQEIAEEFGSYWSRSALLPSPSFEDADRARRNERIVTTAARLSFAPHQARPATLGELIDWANHWDQVLGEKIISALASLSVKDPTVTIHAQNASVAATVRASARGEAFQESLARPGAWRRYIATNAARALSIERSRRKDYDLAKLFGSSGEEGRAPLNGRYVVLIGCGAIGGYLSRLVAQLGAGCEGRLVLIDKDFLSFENIRRHQLGLGDLVRGKADACAEAIRRDYPGLIVDAVVDDVTKRTSLLFDADLIIDATGEHGLSERLNHWALDRRPSVEQVPALLFTWIAGLGAAVQSFLIADDRFACYRCLQPDLLTRGRFDPLKEVPPEPSLGCGDQPSTPYGPAAPMAAASLAAAHASDWAQGRSHPRLRTVRMDWNATVKRDPASPDKMANCPACQTK